MLYVNITIRLSINARRGKHQVPILPKPSIHYLFSIIKAHSVPRSYLQPTKTPARISACLHGTLRPTHLIHPSSFPPTLTDISPPIPNWVSHTTGR